MQSTSPQQQKFGERQPRDGAFTMDLDQGLRVLGLEKNTDAETGRRTWRTLVRQWHPDRFAQNPEMRTLAEERLKEINGAWAVVAPQLARVRIDPPPPRPGILKALRRIHLRRVLREIFAEPHRTVTAPGIRLKAGCAAQASPSFGRGKSFDEVFNEVSQERQPRPARRDNATQKRGLTRQPRPVSVSSHAPGAVEGVEATDRVGPVRRPGRVRGIGRKR